MMLTLVRQSKTLSDNINPSLELQGIPWIIRKAISFATITGKVTQTKDRNSVTCIQIAQTASDGIKGKTKIHRLNGTDYFHSSGVFGTQVMNANWVCRNSADWHGLQDWVREARDSMCCRPVQELRSGFGGLLTVAYK